MKKADNILLTIETPAIGDVVVEVPYTQIKKEEKDGMVHVDNFVLNIPNRIFYGTDHTKLDLSMVVSNDINMFKKLNARSDEKHQVYIDTLCIYGVKISGNYIRVEYWFHQDGNEDSHRMCSGVLTHCHNHNRYDVETIQVFPECYSQDVCVYW